MNSDWPVVKIDANRHYASFLRAANGEIIARVPHKCSAWAERIWEALAVLRAIEEAGRCDVRKLKSGDDWIWEGDDRIGCSDSVFRAIVSSKEE